MTLYLLPNLLDEAQEGLSLLPPIVSQIVPTLQGLIAESERGGRRYLRRFSIHLPIVLLNEHTQEREHVGLVEPLLQGEKWGLISDAGMPCIADPGAKLVQLAREKGVEVEAISGPSSILLALVLSGIASQAFTFHGYLPRERLALETKIRAMEKAKGRHLFIETPYRNQKLLDALLAFLSPKVILSIAWDLSMPTQGVLTAPLAHWKKNKLPELDGKPAVFQIFTHEG